MENKIINHNVTMDETKKLWFFSDLHFNHCRLVKSTPYHFDEVRNFDTVQEMNNILISNWQNTVGKNDIVIFSGDLMMNTPMTEVEKNINDLFIPLNGIKYWIKGNHDHQIIKKLNSIHFDFIKNRIYLVDAPYLYFNYHNKDVFIQHHDYQHNNVFSNQIIDINDTLLIHGHTHLKDKISIWNNTKCHNVCFEARIHPVSFEELCQE